MRRIVSREEMRRAEQYTISQHGISSLILMERAALSVCDFLSAQNISLERPLVVCGTGNNGGDGMAVARILAERGYTPEAVLIGSTAKCSQETASQIRSLESYGIQIHDKIMNSTYTVVIDALFGTGLKRNLTGVFYDTVMTMNALTAYKVAVDIPSGIDADTGAVMGTAFLADTVVTFAYGKPGLYLYPGNNYSQRVVVTDIGVRGDTQEEPVMLAYEAGEKVLPVRKQPAHKGTYGKVLLFAGSKSSCGAAILAAKAAMRMGAGMVKLVTSSCNREAVMKSLPEAMLLLYEDGYEGQKEFLRELEEALSWADVIGMGPGMSMSETAVWLMDDIEKHSGQTLVLDADALHIIADKNPDIIWEQRDVIVTPHIKEMERLCKLSVEEIRNNPITCARSYAMQHNVTCVLKDARTVIAAPDGNCYLNLNGNPGMATAGAGDVLTGVICALLAQRMLPLEAAAKGVYLHAAAGDHIAEKQGEYSMIASDLIQGLVEIEPEMTKL